MFWLLYLITYLCQFMGVNKMNKKSGFLEVIISLILLFSLLILFAQWKIMEEYSYLIIVVSLSISVIPVLLSLANYLKNILFDKKRERFEEELHLQEYSLIREHIEREIADLQKKLINSELDWEKINHLPLSAQKIEYDNGPVQNSNFIKRFGLNEDNMTIDKKMVFFLTPFSKENIDTYYSAKEICAECGLNLYRGDEEFTHEDILTNIIRYIVKSRIVIANIDGKNPNVFYELGIAHSLGKPTILISKTPEKVPFDIQQNRIVFFNNSEELKLKLSKELSRILIEH